MADATKKVLAVCACHGTVQGRQWCGGAVAPRTFDPRPPEALGKNVGYADRDKERRETRSIFF